MDERQHRLDDHRYLPACNDEHKGLMSPADKLAIAAMDARIAVLAAAVAGLQTTLAQVVVALQNDGIYLEEAT